MHEQVREFLVCELLIADEDRLLVQKPLAMTCGRI